MSCSPMRLSCLLICLLSVPGTGVEKSGARRSPNMILLFTDDQRADTIGALGNRAIRTPTLDSLARDGFVFRNTYCLGSNMPAVCMPSRNMLLSGRAYFRWQGPQASGDEPNLPVAMKQAGYITYHHGKRSNSAQLIQEKFEINKYLADDRDREGGEPGRAIVDEAIEFLRSRTDDRPFFMYLAFANPHDPRVAAPRYLDLYEPGGIPLPRNFLAQHPFDNGEVLVRDELLAPWPRTPDEIRRHFREYYAVISGLDFHIGRLLAVLKERGLRDNTVVLYSSDNGLSVGSHGLMGKQNLYEEGMKVPLILNGPGIPTGQSDALVYLLDLFPTLCELAGSPVPGGLDGRSLRGVIEGKARSVRDSLFLSYRDVQRALRDAQWKIIRYPQINRTQLFDLIADPHELHDLAGDSSQAVRTEQMMNRLAESQRFFGDTLPLTTENPKEAAFTPPTGEALDALLKQWKIQH